MARLVLPVVCVLVTMVGAQPSAPKVYGVGVQSCAEWLREIPPGDVAGANLVTAMKAQVQRLSVIAWATGYVTGAAAVYATGGIVLRETTGESIVESIERHCKANPGNTVEQAA